MGSAIGIRDGVRKGEQGFVVPIVILDDAIDKDIVLLFFHHDRLGMDRSLGLHHLLHKFLNAVLIEKRLRLTVFVFVGQRDG